jgi:hypothetical protein|tara:strand:+ start:1967 stop:2200 length:234 start_codon:yes stop_codon:yes gene_type:complete
MSNGTKQKLTAAQIKKMMAKFMKDQKYLAGKKLKKPGGSVADKSLAGMRSSSGSMLKQLTSPKPRLAKRGGKMKKKK